MHDETEFRRAADAALESLKRHLIEREEENEDGHEGMRGERKIRLASEG